MLQLIESDLKPAMQLSGPIVSYKEISSTVEYTDPTDASGDPNTVTDSATFDS